MVKRVLLGSLVAAVLATAGCSGGSSPAPATTSAPPASSPAAETPSTQASPSDSTSPSLAALPVAQCLTGTWSLVRFVGAGGNTYGTGEGGDVTVAFSGGTYTLTGQGKKPITLTLAANRGSLLVDGTATGTYTVDGSAATFASTGATGTGTIELNGQKQTLAMSQVASVVGLKGSAQVACTSASMTVTLQAVRLEFDRS